MSGAHEGGSGGGSGGGAKRPGVVFWGALGVWLLLWFGSFLAPMVMEATGDGFTRGLNRVARMFAMQGASWVVAIFLWITGRGFARETLARRLSMLPGALSISVVVFIIGLFVWARVMHP